MYFSVCYILKKVEKLCDEATASEKVPSGTIPRQRSITVDVTDDTLLLQESAVKQHTRVRIFR